MSCFAHGSVAGVLEHWTFEPFTTALLVFSASAYGIGLCRLWKRTGTGRGIRWWEAASFGGGLLLLAIALLSPLAWASEALFSAHMTQHQILMLLVAPLLVFGRPLHVAIWTLGPSGRDRAGRWTRAPAIAAAWHALTGPAAAFLLHAAALWIWHLPALYEAALASDGVHAVQHASFVITAVLFWWGMVYGRYGRLGYGVGVLYVFLTAFHSSLLGALVTIAPSVWYPTYAGTAAARRIDGLADQQLAGLIMWIPSSLVFIVFGLGLLAAWLGHSERRLRAAGASHASPRP